MARWYANCSIFIAGKCIEGLALKDHFRLLAAALLAIPLAGCGQQSEDSGDGSGKAPFSTAATLGDQVVLTVEEYLASEPYASASRRKGERQAAVCKACHSLDAGGPHMIGPALHGIFGAKAGTRSGFEYSAVLRNADFVWTPEALDAWLAQPGRFLPGNRMTFAGVYEQEDRDGLIAYLLEATTTTDTE
jgi:cytochrome c